jgi:hypothetical protein
MKDPEKNSDSNTDNRIVLLGLGEVLKGQFTNHVPGWIDRNWSKWDDRRRRCVLWAVLEALFAGDLVLPDANLSEWGASETHPVTKTWMETIFRAYGDLKEADQKWLNRSLRHYEVKNLWELLQRNQQQRSRRTKTAT